MRPQNLLLLLVVLVLAMSAAAQTTTAPVSPKMYSGMRWRMIGPFRGGRALTAAGIAGDRDTYYFGSVGGGVWKTVNAGQTWTPIFDGQSIASIGSLAVAPSDPNVIYVGTGEASIRSDISFGNGVYKSTDAGRIWQHIGLEDTRHIGRVLVDPKNPDIVFVAALGHAYGPNETRGVFRSTDGGRTWTKVLYKDANTGAIDLAFDPDNSRIVYATLWNAHRPPWSTYAPVQGPGGGLYKSTDGGSTWTQISGNGLPTADWGRAGIATIKNVVYLLLDTLNGQGGGLYRSDDRGNTWKQVSTDRRLFNRQWYFGEITTDPTNPDIVYVPAVSVYKSADGGKTFTVLKGAPGGDDYHFLWIDPTDGRRMIVASDQGTVISVDGGSSWSSWYNQPTAQMYHVSTDNQFPTYYVYGAQQDSGTVAIASRSDYGSITERDWYSVGAGESGYIAPDPSDPNIVYGGDTYGRVFRFDKRTGQPQDISPTAVSTFGEDINQRTLRFTWTSPIVFVPQKPHAILMGAQYILRSDDRGHSWHRISPDLTGCATAGIIRPEASSYPKPLSTENATARCYGVVYTIAPSPVQDGVIWAGTDTGRIHITRDGGKTWQDVTSNGLDDWSKISMIDASPHDPATAYAAVDRHRLDDYVPAILRTHDFGKTWTRFGGTPSLSNSSVRVVREDPKRKGLLYAGTETGAFVSFNDGDSWQPLNLNLPVTPIHDLIVHNDDLIVATHGRSFWILDDLEPLRQISTQLGSQPATLFRPPTAYRLRSDQQHDTPWPPETPMGQNPPSGAILDFYLAQPSAEVGIEIRDSAGNIVRRYSSHDQEPPHPPVAFPEYWFPKPQALSGEAGHHRLVWNMRYADPPAVNRSYDLSAVFGVVMEPNPRGPLALPGKYEVRLIAGGTTYSQTLTLAPDPRLNVTPAELGQQHSLEMQIVDAMQQAWDALQKARSAQGNPQAAQLAGGRGTRGDTFASLLGSLGSLLDVVDSADTAPTEQAQSTFRDLKQRLDTVLVAWKAQSDRR
jgi:photosystem II stability/assembly factor-like uncharacterized protein